MASSRILQNVFRIVAPLVRTLPPLQAPATTPAGRRLGPVLGVGGMVFGLSEDGEEKQPRLLRRGKLGPMIPTSIEMLVVNDVPVPPALLVKALPWEELETEEAKEELERILAWKERGHKVDPQTAANICKKVGTWLLVKEMSTVDTASENVTNTVAEVLRQSDCKMQTMAACRAKIKQLLKEDKVDFAYKCAQQQVDALDQMNELLENAREQIERTSRGVWAAVLHHLKIAGGCIVLYFTLELIGTLPIGIGLDSLSCLQEIAMDGGALMLTEAAALSLSSPDYAAYIERVCQHQRQRQAWQQRLTAMMAEIMVNSPSMPS
eukprot:m.39333 g.39333  ORF g.39333 m.39333 type:complete len:322 (+) comp11770_c0_seq1:275-1240(+)